MHSYYVGIWGMHKGQQTAGTGPLADSPLFVRIVTLPVTETLPLPLQVSTEYARAHEGLSSRE